MKRIFRDQYEVKTHQLDYKKEVPVSVLVCLLQESAGQHAVELGFGVEALLKRNLTWVLLRLRVKLFEYPMGGQKIEIETWPSGFDRRYAYRDFKLFQEGSDHPFAVASTSWMLIDTEKMRPTRVNEVFTADLIERDEKMIAGDFPRLVRGDKEPLLCRDERVRLADIDVNNHVNNVHYVEWLMESVPAQIWQHKKIEELEVEYRKEASYGDIITVETWQEDEIQSAFVHFMSCNGHEVFRARSIWT